MKTYEQSVAAFKARANRQAFNPDDRELQEAFIAGILDVEDDLRNLLWAEHPECCGRPVVGAEYMGSVEHICCGCPEGALLNDKQVIATLRSQFPDPA